jgi:uncharacterized protein (TIGR02145 family)
MRKLNFLLVVLSLYLFLNGCKKNNDGTVTVVPLPPSNLTATAVPTTQVNLTWTDNSTNEAGFKIQRKTGSTSYADVTNVNADVTTYTDNGLTPNTTYTYRVYAFNAAGNSLSYTNEVTIATSGSISSITICSQAWSVQNLSVSKYRNGDPIPQVTDPIQWASLMTGAWCWYNNDSASNWRYGKLYNWYAVKDPRGLAPQGWHIPSEAEWNKLVKCIDPSADTACQVCNQSNIAGGAMKDAGTASWISPNVGATNSSGFAGLPAGVRSSNGVLFEGVGGYAVWWSTNEFNATLAWRRGLYTESSSVGREYTTKSHGLSVRLVKD